MHKGNNVRGIYFTADTHFGHFNIIRYTDRPFHSLEEMDEKLLSEINERVSIDDVLYHIGDFCMSKRPGAAEYYRSRIRCRNVIMVTGNHDPHYSTGMPRKEFGALFSECYPVLRRKIFLPTGEVKPVFMHHYAQRVWDKSHFGAWHLYGHSHSTLPDDPRMMSMDVGVDAAAKILGKYRPFAVTEIMEFMSHKQFTPVTRRRDV
jgi:calcineurin-like phosphoesterase family protein